MRTEAKAKTDFPFVIFKPDDSENVLIISLIPRNGLFYKLTKHLNGLFLGTQLSINQASTLWPQPRSQLYVAVYFPLK